MWQRALDVVFPRRCAGCGDGAWPFCDACHGELVPLGRPWCRRCGHPCRPEVERCAVCPPPPLATTRAAFAYRGPAAAAIRRLKFSGWREVAPALAMAIVATGVPEADVVTWVPLARRRRAERGYDQARVLAGAVARELGLPLTPLVRRTVATAPQARRGAEERREAMRGVFTSIRAVPSRVVLVDDVLTTGATLASCATALVEGGAREVHGVAAARSLKGFALHGSRRPAYPRVGPRPGLWLPGDPPR